MALVTAWDKNTGEKLPHLVPKHWIGHPALGKDLTATQPKGTAAQSASKTTKKEEK